MRALFFGLMSLCLDRNRKSAVSSLVLHGREQGPGDLLLTFSINSSKSACSTDYCLRVADELTLFAPELTMSLALPFYASSDRILPR